MFVCGNATATYTVKSRIVCFGYMHPATVSETQRCVIVKKMANPIAIGVGYLRT